MAKDKSDSKDRKDRKASRKAAKAAAAGQAPQPDLTPAEVAVEPVASTSTSSSSAAAAALEPDRADVTLEADENDTPAAAAADGSKAQVDDGSLLEIDPDAPAPLSRAALRKAKSNPALAADGAGKGKTKADDGAEAKSSSKPGKYSVWVGNLAFKTTEQELREYFRPALTPSAGKKGKGKAAAAAAAATAEEDEDEDEKDGSSSSGSESEASDADDDDEGADADAKPKKARPEPTITRVNLPRTKAHGGRPGVNKGFAYVDFSNWASQQAAVKLSEGHLHGRALLIKSATDFSNRPEAPKAALASLPAGQTKSKTAQALLARQRNPVGSTLFVGNLGFEATEAALRNLIDAHWRTSLANNRRHAQKEGRSSFLPESETAPAEAKAEEGEGGEGAQVKEEGGEGEQLVGTAAGLRKVRMAQFQDTGKCKGFAFLDFFTPAQATAALVDMRNHRLDGRALKLEYASPSAAARSGTGSHSFNAPIAGGADGGGGGEEDAQGQQQQQQQQRTGKKVRPMKAERAAAKLAAAVAAGTATPEEVAAHAAAASSSAGGGERKRAFSGEGGERKRPAKLAKWEQSGRQAPGAALAMAKRQAVGIVEGTGTKVTFD